MTIKKRLGEVERKLSVKDLVLLEINESRKFPDPLARARAIAAKGRSVGTLCERISLSNANYSEARLAVYNATVGGHVVACNNFSSVFFPTTAGQQFLIRVGGRNTSGNGVLRIICTPDPCYANCDSSTIAPILNVNDFTCFLNLYAAGNSLANCDNSTTVPILNVNDFTCFLNRYATGCP